MLYTLVSILVLTGCASTSSTTVSPAAAPVRLSGSTVTFTSLEDGKDAGSVVTVQLLRGGNELVAETRSAGTEFDDKAVSPPLVMSLTTPWSPSDADSGSLRIRLAPEGRDTWTFNVRLALTYSDNTTHTYGWTGVRVDERVPERTLTLAGARVP
jgi:hypothetical protein